MGEVAQLSSGTGPVGVAVDVEADQSPTLGRLALALAKAQKGIRGAAKDKVNPHFKSKYADLASIWEACREPLAINGLAVLQPVTSTGKSVIVTTMLVHESGEFIRSRLEVPVAQATAQGMGSAITYARRYALASLVGVAADEDDDGNAASSPANDSGRREFRQEAPRQSQPPAQNRAPAPAKETPHQRLTRVMGERSIPKDVWEPVFKSQMGTRTLLKQITDADVDVVIKTFPLPPEDGIPRS